MCYNLILKGGTVLELGYLKIKTGSGYLYGGDQKLFGKAVSSSGCGMIAACDVLLWLSGKACGEIPFPEYAAFAEKLRDETFYKGRRNFLGIFPRRLAKILTEKSGRKFSYIPEQKLHEKKLEEIIFRSLNSGAPVIVRVGFSFKGLPYKIKYPASGKVRTGKMSWHYITVTGISKGGVLTFSSWGGRGTADCRALSKSFGFTGGIIAADYLS